MTGLPPWVAQHIATTTGLDPRLGRAARAATCPRCHAQVLRGLDDDRCAFTVHADPTRLTPTGEALAVLTGRATFTLDGHPLELNRRDEYRIRGNSADAVTVLPEHKCGAPELPNRAPESRPPTRVGKDTDEPPF